MRLPYKVRVKVWIKDGTTEEGFLDLEHNYGDVLRDAFYYNEIKDIKPYLRSLSSMTEEERKEFDKFCVIDSDIFLSSDNPIQGFKNQAKIMARGIAWLLKNHFDFNGLIEKDLAIEVTVENNPYKYFPSEFSSYEDYVEYLKEKGLALEAPE